MKLVVNMKKSQVVIEEGNITLVIRLILVLLKKVEIMNYMKQINLLIITYIL